MTRVRFVYYGVVLFVTRIYDKDSGDDDDTDDDSDTCDFNYQEIFVSAASESVGVLLVALVIDWWVMMWCGYLPVC